MQRVVRPAAAARLCKLSELFHSQRPGLRLIRDRRVMAPQARSATNSPPQNVQEPVAHNVPFESSIPATPSALQQKIAARKEQRQREQTTYQASAVIATVGFGAAAVLAVYYRFMWHSQTMELPLLDVAGTLLLVFGGVVGMEYYARWAHKVLWHDFQPGWALHESHHKPRVGPFEANDVFAIMNAVPAMGLCGYGFLRPDVWGGLCFGAGLGITLFGILYMFIHDGLVHKRFPVGPVARVPYLRRVAVAHKLHHSEKYGGVPWGMFLGPLELEQVGGKEELDRMVKELEL